MSIKALNWAYKQSHGLNSTSKFVLTALADYANEDNCAYPSKETLSSKTLLDRKTVVVSLQRLIHHGFIQDTGERTGRTGQVRVYQLIVESVPNLDALKSPSVPNLDSLKGSENGTVGGLKEPNKGSENGTLKGSQKRDTEPSVRITLEPKKRNQLSNFVEFLKGDRRFDGLDVDWEVERACAWCKKKNRAVTERFLESWLLHAEQPLEEDEEEVGSLATEDYYSWEGWTEERRRALLELWPNAAEPPVRWDKISQDVKQQIEARVKEGWPA